MVHLKNPPEPKNKNWMVFVAFLLFGLALLVAILTDEAIEKPKRDSEIKKQIKVLEHQIAEKDEQENDQALDEAKKANEFDADLNLASAGTGEKRDAKFVKQENKLKQGTIPEPDYLKERTWGFWYIVLPLFIVIGIFLFWVWKKHRKWAR